MPDFTPLAQKHCVPCEGGVKPFDAAQITNYLPRINQDWRVVEDIKIERQFVFKRFMPAIEFINQVAAVAEAEAHHPDISLYNYNKVKIILSTHAIGGLSENDFILAAKIDGLTP